MRAWTLASRPAGLPNDSNFAMIEAPDAPLGADEFRDYILGFIFYKYLSERMHSYANGLLHDDKLDFTAIDEGSDGGREILQAVKDASVEALGYFLNPSELFSAVAKRGEAGAFILGDLATILSNIERSTMGTESEEDFDHLFEDLDLTSTKLGRSEDAKNTLIAKVLAHLDAIDRDTSIAASKSMPSPRGYSRNSSGCGRPANSPPVCSGAQGDNNEAGRTKKFASRRGWSAIPN